MQQPLKKDRYTFLVLCTLTSLGLFGGALQLVHLNRDLRWVDAQLEVIDLGLTIFLMLGMSAGIGWLAIQLARGPSLRGSQHVSSAEWGYCIGSAVAAGLFGSVTLSGLVMLRDESYESFGGTVFVLLLVAPLSVFFTLGVIFTLWGLATRGRSRVILPTAPLLAGTPLECTLEIPFDVGEAPPVSAVLSLVRSKLESPLNDMAADEATCWSQKVDSDAWQPNGRRRCHTTFVFDLPEGVPHDFGREGTSHWWQLEVQSTRSDRSFMGSYLLPIAFADPVAEGLIGTR